MRKLPLSGSEIPFKIQPWLKNYGSNNCYAYAVNDFASYRHQKSVPGARVSKNLPHSYTHCKGLLDRVIADNPRKVYKTNKNKACKKGYYKIMMVAGNGLFGSGDFHFYKQHGLVKHKVKPGETYKGIANHYNLPYHRVLKSGPLKVGHFLNIKINIWSHKRGWATGPLIRDACNRVLTDPSTACRKYSINYKNYCGSLCIRNKGMRVGIRKTNGF